MNTLQHFPFGIPIHRPVSGYIHRAHWESIDDLVAPFLFQKLRQLLFKRFHIFKLSIDRGKADVGDLIQCFEGVHNVLADLGGGNFFAQGAPSVLQII